MEAIVPDDLTFIRGIEFSCVTEAGKCHILGYGYDKDAQAFQDILQKGRDKRRLKLERRLTFMKERFGIEISQERREALFAMDSVGKPHLGRLLVSMGLAGSKDEAITTYVNPCQTGNGRLDGGEVIRAILASGGIPVWAHPYGGTGEKEVPQEAFERQLAVLLRAGLRGLECYYSKYTKDQIASLLDAAEKNGLLVSGGSDYHGKNKEDVQLGALGGDGEKVFAEKLTVLRECASKM